MVAWVWATLEVCYDIEMAERLYLDVSGRIDILYPDELPGLGSMEVPS